MRILGIETSCDESAAAIYDEKQGILSHLLYSQVALHDEYGGVVPELASRDHARKTLPLIKQALQQAHCSLDDIDGIAYTCGPGLAGALMVGTVLGRTLAWARNIPAIGIHHMEGHLLSPLLEEDAPDFPFLALLISGGHTLLIHVRNPGCYELLGTTLDDAVGEAFDKTAKLLGLGYPGGPALSALAKQGDSKRFRFPRPMTNKPGLDFSFSGLKTFAMNTYREFADAGTDTLQCRADIAIAFEDAVADTLGIKCKRALQHTGLKRLVIAGGVSANTAIRERLNIICQQQHSRLFYPRPEFCTDNAAMIAYAGLLRLKSGLKAPLGMEILPRWDLASLSTISSAHSTL